jgi:hypothetical protein
VGDSTPLRNLNTMYTTGLVFQADGVTGGECGRLHSYMKLEYLTSLVLQADGVTGGECGRLHPFYET